MLPRTIDLFSGCGGMSLGFQAAGFDIKAAFDNWSPAADIYASNFDHPIYREDLFADGPIDIIKKYEPDLIIGGPPCQDFSISGKRTEGKRANLTIRFAEIVREIKPTWVVFENVYNIKRFKTLVEMKQILSDAGYGLSENILDASYFGVPQRRKRYFLIGRRGEEDGFFDNFLSNQGASSPLTVRQYLGSELDTDYYYMHPRSYARRAVFSVDEPASTIRGINRPIPSNYVQHRGDAASIDSGQVRHLTTKERSRIQTFPATFNLPGTKTNVELAVGNAVPPNLAEFLARRISAYIESERD